MKLLWILLLVGSMAAQVKLGGGSTNLNGHSVSGPLSCADTSGSGTAQVCTTSPSFTPASGDCVLYTTTTANTGTGLTLNVNSLGAKSVSKWQNNTTTLAANDVLANARTLLCYDGTNWELGTIGNVPTGSGTVTNSGTLTLNKIILGSGTTVVKADTSGSDGSGNLSATSLTTTGTVTAGSGGGTGVIIPEGTCTAGSSGQDAICGNSTFTGLEISNNGSSTFNPITQTIANGTAAINPGAVSSGACSSAIDGGTATNVLTTDVIVYTPNADPTAATGWGSSATGAIVSLYAYPTANHVNFKVCNNTGSSITPSSITVNWRVTR